MEEAKAKKAINAASSQKEVNGPLIVRTLLTGRR